MNGVTVIGAGGHAKVVIATLQAMDVEVVGIVDDRIETWGESIFGHPVLGGLERLGQTRGPVILAIGSNLSRQKIAKQYPDANWTSAIHPSCIIHESAKIGLGTVIIAGAVVQPEAVIGHHVIVNTGATVGHDCVLENFVHVAPGVNLAGAAHLEEGVFMGVGSAAIPCVRVGKWTTVGAGAVVVRSLPSNSLALGVPAQIREEKINP